MVFSVNKFRHYLMCNLVIFFVDHMAIKYLVNKAELSGRLARWILLLDEFNYTIKYKSGRMHFKSISPVDDRLINDNLFVVTAQLEWYADIVEFLTTLQLLGE